MIIIFLSMLSCRGAEKLTVCKYNILSWPRMDVAAFGCYLEKELNYRDKKFNCSLTDYSNQGDPCDRTEEYYEGPLFPEDKAGLVHGSIESIRIEYEHGDIREVHIEFKTNMLVRDIQKIFRLPEKAEDFPENVISIQYDENIYSKEKDPDPRYSKWLTITGFDHIGAGESDCD